MSAPTAPVRIFVPIDAAALSVGAEAVAHAVSREAAARGIAIDLVRNGSRGMLWLEPLVEVETPQGRIAYGPVAARDVEGLFDAGLVQGGEHPLRLGLVDDLDWMKRQQRLTFARVGVIDPLSLSDYRAYDGLVGLKAALALTGAEIVETVRASGLRGRGGAGFPTGIKWKTVHDASADQKYIVCNADEGDSGTFADRMLFEGDPYLTIEGMIIAAIAVGATRGYIYLRSEYPHAYKTMQRAILKAEQAGILGDSVLGSAHAFHLEVRLGAGAYICGEETSLLESLEGKRGVVRAKPPIPALKGLFGKPTIVNNVLSFAAVPWILQHGAQAYAEFGMGRSRGTLPVQLGGNVRRGGLIELAFGISLVWPADPGSPGRRPAGSLSDRSPARRCDGLRGAGRDQGHARPWRHRGVRRQRRHGAAGPLRLRLLRQGELRQVHALPDRRDAWRRDDGQDHRRHRTAEEPRHPARSL